MDNLALGGRDIKTYSLPPLNELRIHVSQTEPIKLKLLEGTCECFGTNMITSLDYTLTAPVSYSFFTWKGCQIEIIGKPELIYLSNDTSYPFIANINNELEKDRKHSDNKNIAGPTTLILGRSDVGKTSILKTLCHYALRTGWSPTYVDINPENNNLSIPGTLTAAPIEMQSKPNHLNRFAKTTPAVFFYGHTTISNNKDLYIQQCHALSQLIDSRLLSTQMRSTDFPGFITKDDTFDIQPDMIKNTKHAGLFIDTPGELCTRSDKLEIIQEICTAFKVNVILVVDNDPLHAQLLQHVPFKTLNEGIAIARVPKMLGAVNRTDEEHLWLQKQSFKSYFHGEKGKYTPKQSSLSFKDITMYSTFPVMSVPLTALPLGTEEEYKAQQAQKLDQLFFSDLKLNNIFALSYGSEESTLSTTPVAGFIHCQGLPRSDDPDDSVIYCLFPNETPPYHLKCFLMGSIVWIDA